MFTIMLVLVFGFIGWGVGELFAPEYVIICTVAGCVVGLLIRIGSANGIDSLGDFADFDLD